MIRSEADIWNSKDRTVISEFRMSFSNSYPELEKLKNGFQIIAALLKKMRIAWKRKEPLGFGVLSRHDQVGCFEWWKKESVEYILYTSVALEGNPAKMLEAVCHELGHIFLEHDPGHAGLSVGEASDLSIMSEKYYRLYEKNSDDNEHAADLFTACIAFHPHDEFLKELWKNPLDARNLCQRFHVPLDLSIQMIMAYDDDIHFFWVDCNRKFIYERIPDIYPDQAKSFLNNHEALMENPESALCKAIRTKSDAQGNATAGVFQFFCRAFIRDNGDYIVLGSEKSRLDDKKTLVESSK